MPIEKTEAPAKIRRRVAKRIQRATEHFEGTYRTPPPPLAAGMRGGPVWVSFAKVTSAVSASAGSGGSYGTGVISLCEDGGSSPLTVDSTQTGLTVKNLADKTIAVNSFILVGWIGGNWWVLVPDSCSHLS